jgi:hypothetical protein
MSGVGAVRVFAGDQAGHAEVGVEVDGTYVTTWTAPTSRAETPRRRDAETPRRRDAETDDALMDPATPQTPRRSGGLGIA